MFQEPCWVVIKTWHATSTKADLQYPSRPPICGTQFTLEEFFFVSIILRSFDKYMRKMTNFRLAPSPDVTDRQR